MLRETITNEIQGVEAKVSVVLKDLTNDKWIIKLDENRKFPSASTIKILIMIEALRQVQEGIFALEQKITVKSSDRVDFSIISELDISEYTYRDLITLMIITSDNTATNVLIDLLGYEKINEMSTNLGLTNTVLKRKMMDFEAAKEGRQNETSAFDMALMMEKIYNKTILTSELCEIMIDILKRQTHKDGLPRYITDEISIAHKSGELDGLNHDIGIFYLDNIHYILGIFVTEAQHNLEAKRIIGKVSMLVYDYFKGKGRGINMNNKISKWGIINKTVVPIKLHPNFESEMADEALYGMVVKVLEEVGEGWYNVETHYNYSGYVHESNMIMDDKKALKWKESADNVITHSVVDVMGEATYKSYIVETLTRGATLIATGNEKDGWTEIELSDGKKGWVRSPFISKLITNNDKSNEEALRKDFVSTAMTYLGTQYRWGGRSPLGIDCSGLCSVSYLLNGIIIYRDAKLKEEDMRRIELDEIKPGDLLFFPGHVAMYIGDDKFVHSSASINGVNINSLNPSHSDYREDLATTITGIGTIF